MKIFIGLNILIVAIIIIRSLAEGKVSRKFQYAIWLLIPVFLILSTIMSIPVNVPVVERPVSPSYRTNIKIDVPNEEYYKNEIEYSLPVAMDKNATVPVSDVKEKVVTTTSSPASNNVVKTVDFTKVVRNVWLGVSISILAVVLVNNLFFSFRIVKSRKYIGKSEFGNLNVYRLEGSSSPFLFGKSIYVYENLDAGTDEYRHALCHEYCHYKQGDSIWPLIKYLFVSFLWFDPLIWAAYVLIQRDSEMSVDESVIKILGKDNKSAYSKTLLALVTTISDDYGFTKATTAMSGKNKRFIRTRLQGIMKETKKSIAVTVVVSVFLGSIVGCSLFDTNNVRQQMYVSSDSVWYDSKDVTYGNEQYDILNTNKVSMRLLMASADEMIYSVNTPVDEENYIQNQIKITKYDRDGNLTGSIDINSDDIFVENAFKCEDGYKAIVSHRGTDRELCTLDFANNKITDNKELGKEVESVDKILEYNGQIYIEYYFLDEGIYRSKLAIADTDGNIKLSKISDYENVLWDVDSSGNFFLIGTNYISNGPDIDAEPYKCFKMDSKTGDITDIKISDRIQNYIDGNSFVVGEYIYMVDDNSNEIYRFDILNDEETIVYDYNCCYADFGKKEFFELCYCDETTFIFKRIGYMLGEHDDYVERDTITYTKADKNPNEGKKILKVATITEFNLTEGNSISSFNKNNNDYFLMIDESYNIIKIREEQNIESYEEAITYATDKLQIDIEDGTGPDILLNTGTHMQFQTKGMLLDLNKFIDGANGIKREDYFNSCLEAVSYNGQLYQIPINIWLDGLLVDPELIGEDKTGFTYEEYIDFAKKYGYYNDLFNNYNFALRYLLRTSGNQLMDESGYLNLDDGNFKSMLDFVIEAKKGTYSPEHNVEINLSNMSYILTEYLNENRKNWKYCGLPASKETGITIINNNSAAITACTCSKEGSWEFIKYMLSEEQQTKDETAIPMNINAFENVARSNISYVNSLKKEEYYSEDMVEVFRNWINSTDTCSYQNSISDQIIIEETAAYFAKQKSFDEVKEIITDRVNKMIDERGWGNK